jgi:hypothetical protein
MTGALRAIGRVVRNIGDNLADLPIAEIPWTSLSWLGRAIARLFASSGRDMTEAGAAGLGLVSLILIGIIGVGVFNWLREAAGVTPPTAGHERGPIPGEPEKHWWE